MTAWTWLLFLILWDAFLMPMVRSWGVYFLCQQHFFISQHPSVKMPLLANPINKSLPFLSEIHYHSNKEGSSILIFGGTTIWQQLVDWWVLVGTPHTLGTQETESQRLKYFKYIPFWVIVVGNFLVNQIILPVIPFHIST